MIWLIAFVIFVLVAGILVTFKRKNNYWSRKKVPHLKPTVLLGNFEDYLLLKTSLGEATQALCRKFPDAPYFGVYYGTEPALVVQDLELIKLIMAKDFYYFSGREVSNYSHKEITTQNLFFTYGDQWKVLRQNMTALFTPNKMKNMFHLVQKCSRDFRETLDYETNMSKELNVLPLMARFTMDCIGSTSFGIETNTLAKDGSKNPFSAIGEVLFEISAVRAYAFILRGIWPSIFYGIGLKVFPKFIDDFFRNLLTGVFESRNNKPSSRNDFIDIVLNLKEKDYITCENWSQAQSREKIKLKVNNDLLFAQCEIIFGAGFETSALTMSFVLFELAKDENIQLKALEEVDRLVEKYGDTLEYEHLSEMPYLEACVLEAMRLYPALGTLTREVIHDYTLPSGLHLEKGLRVHIPVHHLHHHPDYFPDPEEYKPERFLADAKDQIKPYTYMAFGEGNRICIGQRFGKILTQVGLTTVLRNYKVELGEGVSRHMVLEPKAYVTRPKNPVKLKLIARN